MLDFIRHLFATDFMPHVYCLRQAGLIWLHFATDGVIALSYFLIPLALVLLLQRRRDLVFPALFGLFSVFIVGCGLTHVMAMITLWYPVYRLDGLIKAVTAIASLGTAVLLFRWLPQIVAFPSPAMLRQEVNKREKLTQELRLLNQQLEERVAERTAQLSESENALRALLASASQSEERFRTLAEAAPSILWSTDARGNLNYVSSRYEEYTGLSAQDLLGDRGLKLTHVEDRERVYTAWKTAVAQGQPYEVECRLRRFDGSYRWFVVRGVPMRESDGQVRQWFGSSTDIDKLMRVEGALRRSNEGLRQFAYAAAHDLQEPLRNVANSVDVLHRTYAEKLDEAAMTWMATASEGAQRMLGMVGDLLTYSRAVDERQEIGRVSAGDAVETALANLNGTISTTDAKIEVGSLPELNVCEVHLVQLFQNLLANALKYRKVDIPPEIRIDARGTPGEWEFRVADNGIGFEPQYADRIFGVFKRLHTRKEYPGNGIGLAICARLVSHYGGRIWAESAPGNGSIFHFTLPAQ